MWFLCDDVADGVPCDDVLRQWEHCRAIGEQCSWWELDNMLALAHRLSSQAVPVLAGELIDRVLAQSRDDGEPDTWLSEDRQYRQAAQALVIADGSHDVQVPEFTAPIDAQLLAVALRHQETIDDVLLLSEPSIACWFLSSAAAERALASDRFRADIVERLLARLRGMERDRSDCDIELARNYWHLFPRREQDALLDWLEQAFAEAGVPDPGADASTERLDATLLDATYWPGAAGRAPIAAAVLRAAAEQDRWYHSAGRLTDLPLELGLLALPFPTITIDELTTLDRIRLNGGASDAMVLHEQIRNPAWPGLVGALTAGEIDFIVRRTESACADAAADAESASRDYAALSRLLLDTDEVERNPLLHLRILAACRDPGTVATDSPPAALLGPLDMLQRTAVAAAWPATAHRPGTLDAFEAALRQDDPWLRLAAAWNLAAACGATLPASSESGPATHIEANRSVIEACAIHAKLSETAQRAVLR